MSEEEKKEIEREEQYTDFYKDLCNKQQKEIEKIKDKNKTLEGLLQGNLFELYLYYKELASKYQANSITKDKIREKIKEKIKEQRQKYFDIHDGKHSINEICFESTKVEGAVEVLKELLEEDGDHIPRID